MHVMEAMSSSRGGVSGAALGLMEDAAVPQGQYLLQVSFVVPATDVLVKSIAHVLPIVTRQFPGLQLHA